MQRYPLVFVPVVALILTCLPGQTIVPTGKGCGTKGTELSVYGSPSPGQSVELRITKMVPTLHQVILGLDNKSWALGKLPWPVPLSWGFATGCSLYVRPDFLLPLPATTQGEALTSVTTAASLVGQSFHFQVMALPASGSAYMTRAVTINTYILRPASDCRSVSHSLTPLIPGIIQSVMTSCGTRSSACCNPSWLLWAVKVS